MASRICLLRLGVLPLLAAVASSSACAGLVRREIDRRYPPVSAERRQLAVIQTAQTAAGTLSGPTVSFFMPARDLSSYVAHVLAEPLPVDPNDNTLKQPPVLSGSKLVLGMQEMTFSTDVELVLGRGQSTLDMSNVIVGGRLSIRLMPEFLAAPPGGDALVRLRPVLSSLEVCRLDFSRSALSRWQLLTRRSILSGAINKAVVAFRDNINGQLSAIPVPLPLEPILAGRKAEDNGKDGVTLTPPFVSKIDPYLARGAILVSPEGLRVVGHAETRILEPDAPVPPLILPLAPEALPPQATAQEIATAYAALTASITRLVEQLTPGAGVPARATADLAKSVIASGINAAFDQRTLQATYKGPVEEGRPCKANEPCDPDPRVLKIPFDGPQLHCEEFDKISCDPRGTCVPFFEQLAKEYLKDAEDECANLVGQLDDLGKAINDACQQNCHTLLGKKVCLGDVIAPGTCTSARNRKEQLDILKAGCETAAKTTRDFLGAPQQLAREYAKFIGREEFYDNVCAFYEGVINKGECELFKAGGKPVCEKLQKDIDKVVKKGEELATIDWFFEGDGPEAARGTVDLRRLTVQPSLERVELDATASGQVTVKGWFKHVSSSPKLFPICPPPPCLDPNKDDCRINLRPTTINFKMAGSTAAASFGIQMFRDDEAQRDRRAFFLDLDELDVDVSVQASPIHALFRQNTTRLPCVFGAMTWTNYLVADLIVAGMKEFKVSQKMNQPPTRLAWADGVLKLPVAWTRKPSGELEVSKELSLLTEYTIRAQVVSAEAANVPVPPPSVAPRAYDAGYFKMAAGIGTALTFGSTESSGGDASYQIGRFAALAPYVSVQPWRRPIGPVVGISPGPRLRSLGVFGGISTRPFTGRMAPLTLFTGARFGGATRVLFGMGWDVGQVTLKGCESCATPPGAVSTTVERRP